MGRRAIRLVCVLLALATRAGATQAAAESPVEGFRIVSQAWHPQERHRGLAVAEMTFENTNNFPVYEPTIACEFLSASGQLIGSRGTHVHMVFPPGEKEIKGIEFIVREKDALPGACRVVSVLTSPSPE
jgi:hypothetical protein